MVKNYIPNHFLAECFVKSLLISINEGIVKGGVITEEQVIAHAQYLDLVYTQSSMLYDMPINAPRPQHIIPPALTSKESHTDDGLIGSTRQPLTSKSSNPPNSKYAPTTTNKSPSKPDAVSASKINVVQSNKGNSQQPRGKKKGKGKNKQQNPPWEN